MRAACDRAGALLILDEIQTGLGRTGRWWASEHDGVVPDIMTTAKSLGGSLVPISATVFTEELREFLIPNPFIHLSTFGGSDLACAVALEVIAVIEENGLVEHAATMGERLFAGLDGPCRRALRGDHRGARARADAAGIQYAEDSLGPRMSYHLARHGVLAIYSGNQPSVMRLMPSLVIEPDEVDFLLAALERAIDDLLAGAGPEECAPARPRRRPRVRPRRGGLRGDRGGLGRAGRGARRLHGQLQRERAAAQDAAGLVEDAALHLLGQRDDLLDGGRARRDPVHPRGPRRHAGHRRHHGLRDLLRHVLGRPEPRPEVPARRDHGEGLPGGRHAPGRDQLRDLARRVMADAGAAHPGGVALRRSIGTATATATSAGLAFAAIDYLGVVSVLAYAPGATAVPAILIGGVLVLLVAGIFSELNGLYPTAAGIRLYLGRAVGDRTALSVTFTYMTTVVLVIAADAFLIGAAVRHVLHEPAALAYVWIAVLLGLAPAANLRGVRLAGWVQTVVTYTVLTGTAVLSVVALFHVGGAFPHPFDLFGKGAFSGIQAVAFALFLYAAFEWVTTTAEEARTPRVITRALFIAPVLIWLVATLFALALTHLVPFGDLHHSAYPQLLLGKAALGTVGELWMLGADGADRAQHLQRRLPGRLALHLRRRPRGQPPARVRAAEPQGRAVAGGDIAGGRLRGGRRGRLRHRAVAAARGRGRGDRVGDLRPRLAAASCCCAVARPASAPSGSSPGGRWRSSGSCSSACCSWPPGSPTPRTRVTSSVAPISVIVVLASLSTGYVLVVVPRLRAAAPGGDRSPPPPAAPARRRGGGPVSGASVRSPAIGRAPLNPRCVGPFA